MIKTDKESNVIVISIEVALKEIEIHVFVRPHHTHVFPYLCTYFPHGDASFRSVVHSFLPSGCTVRSEEKVSLASF